MSITDAFRSQYLSALQMMRQAIDRCPASLWSEPEPKNRFWHIAYHALFCAHLYLQDHTGQLIDRLRTRAGIGVEWVGRA